MRPFFNRAILVTSFAVLWFVSGYVVVAATDFLAPWALQGGLINLIIGLLLIAAITATERGRRLFYQGPDQMDEQEGLTALKLMIIFLLAIPVLCLFAAFVWWVFGAIGRYLGLWKL